MELTQEQIKSLQRLLALIICLGLIFTTSAFISITNTRLQEHDSRNINISGMQRMLSQKIALHAQHVESSDLHSSLYSKKRILAAAVRFSENHELLVNEQTNPHLSETVKAIYFSGEKSLDARVREYANKALLISNGASVQQTWQYTNQDIEALLLELDNIVSMYEKEASFRVKEAYLVELFTWLISLVFLVILFSLVVKKLAQNALS
jgi:nitrate/nitrite-specific signal transduction histidine kinase